MVELIRVRLLESAAEMGVAERLLTRVWGGGSVQLDAATMMAFSHTGNYVAGAFSSDTGPDELVGCAVGFFGPPDLRSLHSHIAAVDPRCTGRGIGMALKNHQRSWCLDQGITSITWTFDPAIARNAFFNLAKLGVTAVSYLEDFYGSLEDGLNAGSPSDRLLVRWQLGDPPLRTPDVVLPRAVPDVALSGARALVLDAGGAPDIRPVERDADSVLIQVPPDIERLRREDAELAARWRFALREVLATYVNSGEWQVTGFLKHGIYVMERSR